MKKHILAGVAGAVIALGGFATTSSAAPIVQQ